MLSLRLLQAAARVQSQDSCWLQCATQNKSLKENIRGTFTVVPAAAIIVRFLQAISSRHNIAFNIAAERYRHYLTL